MKIIYIILAYLKKNKIKFMLIKYSNLICFLFIANISSLWNHSFKTLILYKLSLFGTITLKPHH